LLAAWRANQKGEPIGSEDAQERELASISELSAPLVLRRARAAYDGPLVLVKGPETGCDYPAPATRPFRDLDLLTDDAEAAQAALLASGFREMGEPEIYEDIHHLRPLWWPGSPLVIELHSRPKWPDGLEPPSTEELLASTEPSRLGIAGLDTLAPEPHALVLAAHAWAHEPLARAGHLIDIAATLDRGDRDEARALARRWGVRRLWRTTEAATVALLQDYRTPAMAVWARHLRATRERTVLEAHLQDWLAPFWGLPVGRAPRVALRALREDLRREDREPWRAKLVRSRLAMGNARTSKSEHDKQLELLNTEGQ
jgi:hypothetical protein